MNAHHSAARDVDNAAATGEVLDEGALVLRWTPAGHDPVLFVHPSAGVHPGSPPHAGVPVCWPWFGAGRGGGMTPSHGIARTAAWRHVATTAGAEESTVEYLLTEADATSEQWPHPYRLELRAEVAATLTISLTTTNTGAEPVVVEEALHAYLAVGDVREVSLSGLDGVAFHDKTTGEDHEQSGDLVLTAETDRVYRTDGPVTLTDPVLGRRLRVESEGAADRVVWNPWDDKAADIDDVREAWPRFVCVEAGNVLDDAVTIAPGATHTLTYRLTVEDL